MEERLKKIDIENNIWIIYLGIIFLSFLANSYEKDYFINKNNLSKKTYRELNIFIFIILIIVYSYFEIDSLKSFFNTNKTSKQTKLDNLTLLATTFVLLSGIIFLYILIVDDDLLEEIAFN
jgi:uncharacterized membrane protein